MWLPVEVISPTGFFFLSEKKMSLPVEVISPTGFFFFIQNVVALVERQLLRSNVLVNNRVRRSVQYIASISEM
jgi:hypothetical protein